MLNMVDLPDDVAALKAIVIAVHARNERLELLVAAFRQAMFGRKSEKIDPDQFELALEDIETVIATIRAEEEACEVTPKPAASSPRAANRGSLPKHLPRVEEVIEPEATVCGCGGGLHRIGEDVSERLDVIPAQFRVIVTRRPKYACRPRSNGVVQAPAPARLIPGGMPTEATVAHVLVSKYADHLPLYRQAQIYSRQGIDLDRSTLAEVGVHRPGVDEGQDQPRPGAARRADRTKQVRPLIAGVAGCAGPGTPTAPFAAIAGHVAFYAALLDEVCVGDLRVIPQPGNFYGGWVTPNLDGQIKGAPGTQHW